MNWLFFPGNVNNNHAKYLQHKILRRLAEKYVNFVLLIAMPMQSKEAKLIPLVEEKYCRLFLHGK